MTVYVKTGIQLTPADHVDMAVLDVLPPGNYMVKFNERGQSFYLEQVDSFTPPKKLYGNSTKRSQRIINTFNSRDVSTGVMLIGEKGSGKTLLARQLSIDLAPDGVPTLIVNEPYCGDLFNQFIQNITQPALVLFDEFEKTYDREAQSQLLTLMDGVFPTKKMFVLTCNDRNRVDQHMTNRPGRIYYLIQFAGLEHEFIEEYCQDNLDNKDNISQVVNISSLFTQFNFDMLKALVEEMNRYNESAADAIQMLNARPSNEGDSLFDLRLIDPAGEVVPTNYERCHWQPLANEEIDVWTDYQEIDGMETPDDVEVTFLRNDLQKFDKGTNGYTFRNKNGWVLTLSRVVFKEFDFHAF